jgi:hypothetical protein
MQIFCHLYKKYRLFSSTNNHSNRFTINTKRAIEGNVSRIKNRNTFGNSFGLVFDRLGFTSDGRRFEFESNTPLEIT